MGLVPAAKPWASSIPQTTLNIPMPKGAIKPGLVSFVVTHICGEMVSISNPEKQLRARREGTELPIVTMLTTSAFWQYRSKDAAGLTAKPHGKAIIQVSELYSDGEVRRRVIELDGGLNDQTGAWNGAVELFA